MRLLGYNCSTYYCMMAKVVKLEICDVAHILKLIKDKANEDESWQETLENSNKTTNRVSSIRGI